MWRPRDNQRAAARALVGSVVVVAVGWGAGIASAAPASVTLTTQVRNRITSCSQDDGIPPDYPIRLDAEGSGCNYRKFVAIPSWIIPTITGLRTMMVMDGYYGTWWISAAASDGTTPVGQVVVSNLAGYRYSAQLPTTVIDGQGVVTLLLAGGAYAGAFTSPGRSGVEVDYDDSEPPRLQPGQPPLGAAIRTGRRSPAPSIQALENGPTLKNATLAWGDAAFDSIAFRSTETGAWSGSHDTVFRPLFAPSGHTYRYPGVYFPTLTLTDPAGNAASYPLGTVTVVGPPLPLLQATKRPAVTGRRIVGSPLRCNLGIWKGSPRAFVVKWQRRGRRWTTVRVGKRLYLVTRSDAGRRLRCTVEARRGDASLWIPSVAVRIARRG